MQIKTTELALPTAMRNTAMAYPDKVQTALAKIGSTDKALELLRASDGWMQLMKDYGADTEAVNSIQRGRLYVQAKLGKLIPAKTRQEAGASKGKGAALSAVPFGEHTLSNIRKVAKSEDKIDAYFESSIGGDEPVEMSTAGFLGYLADGARARKDKQRSAKREKAAKSIAAGKTIQESLQAAKFSTICIDPPWDFSEEDGTGGNVYGRGKTTYGSMSHSELLEFPVGDYANDDCHIYLWITNRSLPKGFSLLDAWGFRYVTCLTWYKPSIGMGNYFRGSTEQVLFGVRGSLQLKRKDVGTWFSAKRGKIHSEKPKEFYSMVESCSHAPYLDIFSRRSRKDWTCWGGEL